MHGLAPSYIRQLVQLKRSGRRLRSDHHWRFHRPVSNRMEMLVLVSMHQIHGITPRTRQICFDYMIFQMPNEKLSILYWFWYHLLIMLIILFCQLIIFNEEYNRKQNTNLSLTSYYKLEEIIHPKAPTIQTWGKFN